MDTDTPGIEIGIDLKKTILLSVYVFPLETRYEGTHEDKTKGLRSTLKPSSGGLEQLVTNFSSFRFSSSVKPSTTSQKVWMTG